MKTIHLTPHQARRFAELLKKYDHDSSLRLAYRGLGDALFDPATNRETRTRLLKEILG